MWNIWQKGDSQLSAVHKCDQWIHGRCSKLKKVTPSVARFLFCNKCEKVTIGVREVQQEVMCDEVETVKRFCYLGDRLNASGECDCKKKN